MLRFGGYTTALMVAGHAVVASDQRWLIATAGAALAFISAMVIAEISYWIATWRAGRQEVSRG